MKKKGFTLIEIIVAIAIIAIVAVPIARAIINSAKTNRQSTDLVKATQLCQQKMEDIKAAISSGADPSQSKLSADTDLNPTPTLGTYIVKSSDNNYYIKYKVERTDSEQDSNGSEATFTNAINEGAPVDVSNGPVNIDMRAASTSVTVNGTPATGIAGVGTNTAIAIYLDAHDTNNSVDVTFKNLSSDLQTINVVVIDDSKDKVALDIDPNSQGFNSLELNRNDKSSTASAAKKYDSVFKITVNVYKVKDVANLSNIDSVNPLAASQSKRLDRR